MCRSALRQVCSTTTTTTTTTPRALVISLQMPGNLLRTCFARYLRKIRAPYRGGTAAGKNRRDYGQREGKGREGKGWMGPMITEVRSTATRQPLPSRYTVTYFGGESVWGGQDMRLWCGVLGLCRAYHKARCSESAWLGIRDCGQAGRLTRGGCRRGGEGGRQGVEGMLALP